ncbi:MAG: hypothetical protein A2Z31_09400 [candidate division NC10 bacterium RBG_16_65_8]|nr:MAG: hypothetical protein A2Z31_09400 [candidate division NC10 bacterium RBG_16_65_8]
MVPAIVDCCGGGVISIVIVAVAVLGVLLAVLGLRRLWARRVVLGSLEGLTGLLFLSLAALVAAIGLNLRTYDRLTHEIPVATVSFQAQGDQRFSAVLAPAAGKSLLFDVRGNEWQLDARILKWRGMATVLGLDTVYRLDRFSGRYRDVMQERERTRSVYGLSDEPGLDLWALARRYPRWLPWVDAVYGSATYMPMVNGATYRVTASQTGLLARPVNDIAREAVRRWP